MSLLSIIEGDLAALRRLLWPFGGGDTVFDQPTYAPNSLEAIALMTEAATREGLPPSWGSEPGVHLILQKESMGGQVGIPNYMFDAALRGVHVGAVTDRSGWPKIWDAVRNDAWRSLQDAGQLARGHAPSSATGLGQLIATNVDKYYPSGRAGIGDALEEARGMLRYMAERWKDPSGQLEAPAYLMGRYNVGQEGW